MVQGVEGPIDLSMYAAEDFMSSSKVKSELYSLDLDKIIEGKALSRYLVGAAEQPNPLIKEEVEEEGHLDDEGTEGFDTSHSF